MANKCKSGKSVRVVNGGKVQIQFCPATRIERIDGLRYFLLLIVKRRSKLFTHPEKESYLWPRIRNLSAEKVNIG